MQACKPGFVPQQVGALIIYLVRHWRINRSTHHANPVWRPESIPVREQNSMTYLTFQLVRFS
jgi:hypothetical protein